MWLWAALAWADPTPPPSPDAPGEVMPDRHWDVTRLQLDLAIDPAKGTVSGTATHVVSPLGRPYGTLRLNAVALDVQAVTVDGAAVEPRIGVETIDIPMPATGTRHEVSVTYTARPQTGMHFRVKGPTSPYAFTHVWTQGEESDNRYWFPGWDHPNDQFTYEASIRVPTGMSAVSNGILLGSGDQGDGTTRWTYSLGLPITNYHVAVAAGDFQVVTDDGPLKREYWVPPSWTPEEARTRYAIAGDQAAWFAEWLALPYPWPIYRQVAVDDFLYGGMENPTLTILEVAIGGDPRAAEGEHLEEVVAHELAHHWFGDWLVCYGWRELWLNEGFASYAAVRWQEHSRGPEFAALEIDRYRRYAMRGNAPMAARSWSKVGDQPYASLYARGTMVLHGLETYLGREVFDAGMKRYVAEHGGRMVETEDFRRALEDVSGTHLGWWFDAFVFGASFPEITSSWAWDDGQLTVSVSGPGIELPVDVEIGTATGSVRKRLWTGAGTTRLVVPLDAPPTWVAMDPDGMLLATWEHEQPTAAWAAQLLHSGAALARLDAARALQTADDPAAATTALVEVVRHGDLDPHFRVEMVDALAAVGSAEARSQVLDLATDAASPVRHAVIDALADEPTSPAVVAALEKLTVDPVPALRGDALEALAKHDAKKALPLARKRLTVPDPTPWREHRAALSLIGDHGDAKDLALLLAWTAPGKPSAVRDIAAVNAVVRLDALDDRAARVPEVVAAIAGLLDSPDQGTRVRAIGLLGQVGGAEAEAALEAFAARTTLLEHRERALDAARQARTPKEGGPPAPKAEGPDGERLEQALDALEDRVERLETWR